MLSKIIDWFKQIPAEWRAYKKYRSDVEDFCYKLLGKKRYMRYLRYDYLPFLIIFMMFQIGYLLK